MKKSLKKSIAKTPKEKIIVIYHGKCPDGFGAAWAAWKKFGKKAAYVGARDRLTLPFPIKNKIVYLLDYTYELDVIKKLIKDNIRVTAVDHHHSQLPSIKLTQNYLYDINHSAAPLAWNYFHPGQPVPLMLRYIEDRDIWVWKLPKAYEILMVLDLQPFDFKAWSSFAKELDSASKRKVIMKEGLLLLRHYRSLYGKLISGAELAEFEGKKIFVLNCPHYFVDDASRELIDIKHPMALLWNESSGRIRVSLRSRKNIDVSLIAKKYGGGGHKHASGFSFPVSQKRPWKLIER